MPDIFKGFHNKTDGEKSNIAIDLVVALKSVRQQIQELKEAMDRYEPGLDEHPLQDAHKSYGFFTVTEQEFEAVLGPYKPV